MKKMLGCTLLLVLLLTACTSVEKAAYSTVVAAKAFLDSVKSKHPECGAAANLSPLCVDLRKATDAKDLLIDAGEIYCGGAQFDNGAPCQPPAKGTPKGSEMTAKLKAALSGYSQTEKNLRGVL
jgi:hypothetical protein